MTDEKNTAGAALSEEEFTRIDRALAAVLAARGEFTDFEVNFAYDNADRLERFGKDTLFSDKQLAVIEGIEKKIGES